MRTSAVIQTANVFAALKRLWDASPLPGLVPGGLWEGLPEQSAGTGTNPYASAAIEEGEIEFFTGGFLQPFLVNLTVWSAAGMTDAGRYQRALQRLLNRNNRTALVVAGAVTADVRPVPGESKTDDSRRDAQDVKVTALRWLVLLQGTI